LYEKKTFYILYGKNIILCSVWKRNIILCFVWKRNIILCFV
jgi:hypothetical protein